MEGVDGAPERNIDRVVRYVETMWLPYDRSWVRSARMRLSKGEISADSSELTDALLRDPGLFGFCLRSLPLLENGGRSIRADERENLPALFRTLSRAEWLRLLPTEVDPPTVHVFERCSHAQAVRLREISFTLSASQMFAANYETDPEVAMSCSMLRQLGMALIAWNYPTLYATAVTRPSAQEGIDRVLTRRLGFSPAFLAITLARKWGVSARLLRGMGRRDEAQADTDPDGDRLDRLCKLGESLAMARSPQLYPDRRHDWEEGLVIAEQILGSGALEKIAARASERSAAISQILPASTVSKDRNFLPPSMVGHPTTLQTKVLEFYQELPHLDTGVALRKLIEELAPIAGCSATAIFLADPTSGELSAEVTFEREQGCAHFDIHRPVRFDMGEVDQNIVSRAFLTDMVISNDSIGSGETRIVAVAGRLEPGAVLYVEQAVSLLSATNTESTPRQTFELMRHIAMACIEKL
jgi:hypothetical protein